MNGKNNLYYILKSKLRIGPLTFDEVVLGIKNGKIKRSDFISNNEMRGWRKIVDNVYFGKIFSELKNNHEIGRLSQIERPEGISENLDDIFLGKNSQICSDPQNLIDLKSKLISFDDNFEYSNSDKNLKNDRKDNSFKQPISWEDFLRNQKLQKIQQAQNDGTSYIEFDFSGDNSKNDVNSNSEFYRRCSGCNNQIKVNVQRSIYTCKICNKKFTKKDMYRYIKICFILGWFGGGYFYSRTAIGQIIMNLWALILIGFLFPFVLLFPVIVFFNLFEIARVLKMSDVEWGIYSGEFSSVSESIK